MNTTALATHTPVDQLPLASTPTENPVMSMIRQAPPKESSEVAFWRADAGRQTKLLREAISALHDAASSAGFQYMTAETRERIETAIAKAEGRS